MERIHHILLGIVGVLVALTAAGMWLLWPAERPVPPDEDHDVLYDGTVLATEEYPCPDPGDVFVFERTGPCQVVDIEIHEGPAEGTVFTLDTGIEDYPEFSAGDSVRVGIGQMADGEQIFYVADFGRTGPMLALFAFFVAIVVLVGRWHGLRALVGLGLSLLIIGIFVVPAIIAGQPPFLVAIVGAFGILVIILYMSHGFTVKTTAALVGTAAALGLTAVLGAFFVAASQLTGLASEEAMFVRFAVEGGIDLRGLLLAGLIIGALGVLNDVTVSQASTAFEVHGANPAQTYSEVFRRSMSVGRDHIAAVVNTLALAYVGASIPLLVLFSTGGLPFMEAVNMEVVAVEIVRTLVGSIGLVAAVPFTTALAAAVAVRAPGATPAHVPAHLTPDADEAELTDEELAHRRWVEFLREEAQQEHAPPLPSDQQDE